MRNRLRALSVRVLLPWAFVFCTALPGALRAAETDDNVIASFEVAANGDFLLIPVKVGDEEALFVLDTGSGVNTFDNSLKRHLVSTSAMGTRAGHRAEPLYYSPTALVGRSSLPVTGYARCQDLSLFRLVTRRKIQGILGMQFLNRCVVEIDVDSGRVALLRTSKHAQGTRFAIGIMDRCPTVAVRLPGGEERPFWIDSGASGYTEGNLSTTTIDQFLRARRATVSGKTGRCVTLDGIEEGLRELTVDRFSVGEFDHRRATFDEDRDKSVDDVEGDTLGLQYLSRFTVTFDFPLRVMYLKPGRRFDMVIPSDLTGFELTRKEPDDVLAVTNVEPAGPAQAVGIRKGDRLHEINGSKTSKMNLFEIGLMLRAAPNPLRLRIGRASEQERDVILER